MDENLINDLLKAANASSHIMDTLAPMYEANPISLNSYKMADYQYEVIMERIKEFEDELDDDHEVAVQLASFGKDILLHVTDIGYSNPHTLVFYGIVNGQKSTLIQHMSMLNFLLLAVKKQEPSKPAKRIGFITDEE